MKIYKLYAGMTGEFEILKTDAPENIVVDYIIACLTTILQKNDPQLFFTEKGYHIEFLGCQHDNLDSVKCDKEIDIYNCLSDKYCIEMCPGCNEEQVIYSEGVTPCPECGHPIAPCSQCDHCNYETCPYGYDGTENDSYKRATNPIIPNEIAEVIYEYL